MEVNLIAMSQPIGGIPKNVPKNPMEIVERCASVCYDSKPTEDFKIAKSCAKSGHWSVWEHISFTFLVTGVSRALLSQITRHRVGVSFSVRSTRYCNEENFECKQPIYGNVEQAAEFTGVLGIVKSAYSKLLEYGMSKESARLLLPLGLHTEFYMTVNARELIEISHLRMCSRAEGEIKEMVTKMKIVVSRYCPEVAEFMVPNCEKQTPAFCTEMKSCGKHPKLKDIVKE